MIIHYFKERAMYKRMVKSGDPTEIIDCLASGRITMHGNLRFFNSDGYIIKVDHDIMGGEINLCGKGDWLDIHPDRHGLTRDNAQVLTVAIMAACYHRDVMKAVDECKLNQLKANTYSKEYKRTTWLL